MQLDAKLTVFNGSAVKASSSLGHSNPQRPLVDQMMPLAVVWVWWFELGVLLSTTELAGSRTGKRVTMLWKVEVRSKDADVSHSALRFI